MSEYGKLTATVRDGHGKGVARKLRSKGLTPAVLYGQGGANLSLAIDPLQFSKATDPARNYNTVYTIEIEQADGAKQTVICMVVDYQKDSVRDHLLHVDFMRVDPDKQVERKIPVTYTGRAAGVMKGGRLKTFRRIVQVSAKPFELPVELAIDLTPLDAGETLRIKDVSLPGTTFLENPQDPLALVENPKAKTEEAAAAAPAAAKPAAGKKAPAPKK
jgi:large subunit ribosomal protein L25